MSEKKKIIVIADDFTGAAEIGGIGLRNGLKVSVETKPVFDEEKDIIVVATDSRSMDKHEAALHISKLSVDLLQFDPLFIYKKIDSVLRGNVSEELVAQMEATGKKRTIIIAANPVFKRIIKNGKYYIEDVPLNQTCFSIDSQYPIRTHEVLDLLTPVEGYPIVNLKSNDLLPEKGLIIGDVENVVDLQKWADVYDENTMFAGASGFFDALLKSQNLTKKDIPVPIANFKTPALFIHGSSFPKEASLLKQMIEQGHQLSNMPGEIYYSKDYNPLLLDKWAEEVTQILRENQKIIISCNHSGSSESKLPFRMKKIIALLVKMVLDKVAVHEMLIEGGSTTSEILDQLNVKKLTPIQELDTGVIRMKVEGINELYLTTKPGSYLWPAEVWNKEIIEANNELSFVKIESHE